MRQVVFLSCKRFGLRGLESSGCCASNVGSKVLTGSAGWNALVYLPVFFGSPIHQEAEKASNRASLRSLNFS